MELDRKKVVAPHKISRRAHFFWKIRDKLKKRVHVLILDIIHQIKHKKGRQNLWYLNLMEFRDASLLQKGLTTKTTKQSHNMMINRLTIIISGT